MGGASSYRACPSVRATSTDPLKSNGCAIRGMDGISPKAHGFGAFDRTSGRAYTDKLHASKSFAVLI
jgi:hypothetical protein